MDPNSTVFEIVSSIVKDYWLVSLEICFTILIGTIAYYVLKKYLSMDKNPFENDSRLLRKSYIVDQKKRDAVIKQSFNSSKVR